MRLRTAIPLPRCLFFAVVLLAACSDASRGGQRWQHGRPSSTIRRRHPLGLIAMASPLSVLRPASSFYCDALIRHPIVTNCATAAALSVASDTVAQGLERSGGRTPGTAAGRHDTSRSAWMAVWGYTVPGLMVHYWFVFLNGLFPVAGLTLAGALRKVAVNQVVMSPLMNALFFAFATFTRGDVDSGGRGALIRRKLATDLVPTMMRSCAYWGTVQLVNFLYVPPRFAVLFTNVGFLLWTTYISLVGFRKVAKP